MTYRTQAPAGFSNAMDSGSGANVTVNPQMDRKFLQETQALQQNVVNNMSQQGVGAVQNLREDRNIQDSATYRAQEHLQHKMMDHLQDDGNALQMLGAVVTSEGADAFLGDLAAGAAQAERLMQRG